MYMYVQSGTQAISLKNYCGFNTNSYCSDVCGYRRCPQTLPKICRNMGICCSFRAVAAGVKYLGFMLLIENYHFVPIRASGLEILFMQTASLYSTA